MVTLIGPNGAGKTSTLAAVAGLLRPERGQVLLEGRDVTGLPAHRAVAEGIVLVPEGRCILARMSIEENLLIAAESRAPRPAGAELRRRIDAQYERFPVLGERRRLPAGSLSGGEQQMLAFARALLMRPRILLLDEPSMGLAPLLVARIFELVEAIHRDGATVLLVEQNARLALQISDHAYVLERGQHRARGSVAGAGGRPAGAGRVPGRRRRRLSPLLRPRARRRCARPRPPAPPRGPPPSSASRSCRS